MTVDVVAEGRTRETPGWPATASTDWLVVGGGMSADDVGLFVARWADGLVELNRPAGEVAAALVEAGDWSVFGGLRIRDESSGAAVVPGCCCRIEDWRSWTDVPDGGYPDLGHDGPWADGDDELLRLWPAGAEDYRDIAVADGNPVVIRRADVPALLDRVQADLYGLLDRLRQWAQTHCPEQAAVLVAKADRVFEVSAPA